jgi:hypothetical protein
MVKYCKKSKITKNTKYGIYVLIFGNDRWPLNEIYVFFMKRNNVWMVCAITSKPSYMQKETICDTKNETPL